MSALPSAELNALEQRLRGHVAALATVPRPPSTEAHRQAREYVRERLAAAGFRVHDDPFRGGPVPGVNLLTEPVGPAEAPLVIVGAHYDSLPLTPGADDNASAVAALIELAAALGAQKPDAWTARLVLAAYDQEEYGLIGSRHHCSRISEPVRLMASLEMLGFTDARPGGQRLPPMLKGIYPDVGDFIGIVGNEPARQAVGLMTESFRRVAGLPVQSLVVPGDGTMLPDTRLSDHAPFWDRGLAAVMVTDTSFFRNPHYHQASDTPDTLDYPFLARVSEGVRLAVEALLTSRNA